MAQAAHPGARPAAQAAHPGARPAAQAAHPGARTSHPDLAAHPGARPSHPDLAARPAAHLAATRPPVHHHGAHAAAHPAAAHPAAARPVAEAPTLAGPAQLDRPDHSVGSSSSDFEEVNSSEKMDDDEEVEVAEGAHAHTEEEAAEPHRSRRSEVEGSGSGKKRRAVEVQDAAPADVLPAQKGAAHRRKQPEDASAAAEDKRKAHKQVVAAVLNDSHDLFVEYRGADRELGSSEEGRTRIHGLMAIQSSHFHEVVTRLLREAAAR
jgi:hypothetical protein